MKAMSDKGNQEREIIHWDNEVKPKVTAMGWNRLHFAWNFLM